MCCYSVENLTTCFYNPVLILSSRLRPDLSGALFYCWLSGAEANNKKSGNGGRKKAPILRQAQYDYYAIGCLNPALYRPVTKCSNCRSMSPNRELAPNLNKSGVNQSLPNSSFNKIK